MVGAKDQERAGGQEALYRDALDRARRAAQTGYYQAINWGRFLNTGSGPTTSAASELRRVFGRESFYGQGHGSGRFSWPIDKDT